jgi:MSHA pilin protein MshA
MPSFNLKPFAYRQAGFTLVELITVILILGVLAAVAIPRYTDLQSKARESKVRAIAGAMKSASGIVKAQAIVNSVSCADATTLSVTLEGRSIALNHCYPQALTSITGGIFGAANLENEGGTEWTISMSSGTAGAVAATVEARLAAAPTPANCYVRYQAPTAANDDPDITVVATGC